MAKPTHTIEINGQKHILTIGLGFLDELEKLPAYRMELANGVTTGAPLQMLFTKLAMSSPSAVRDMILIGTMTNHDRPSEEEVENWLYEQLDDEKKSKKLFADFLELFKKLPGAKSLVKATEEEQAKATNQAPTA